MFHLKEIEWGLLTEKDFDAVLSLKSNYSIIALIPYVSIISHSFCFSLMHKESPVHGWSCVFISLKPCHANVS